jgi:hypothetical protein
VLARRESWPTSSQRFGSSAQCLVDAQARYRTRLEEIRSASMDDARRARFAARTQAALKTAHEREGLSRFNAAVTAVRGGLAAEAHAYALQARDWPEWRERADALLAGLY